MANEKHFRDVPKMVRLIDANKIPYHKSGFPTGDGFDSRLDWAFREDVDKIPTVDAVEVVRCRDCIHYDNSEGICWCKLNSKFFPGGMDWHGFPEDGFCSYGERREGE